VSVPEDLFEARERSHRSAELQAFVGPFSRGPGSVLSDPSTAIEVTLAICELFLDAEMPPALTRGDIVARLRGRFAAADVEAQIDRLRDSKALVLARAHEQRYRLRMIGYLGALFAERVEDAGMIDEFWRLLDATYSRLEHGQMERPQLLANMRAIRRGLVGYAGELEGITETGTREDVLRACRTHDRQGRADQVRRLCDEIARTHPDLAVEGQDLIACAQLYVDAVQGLVTRLGVDGVAASELFLLDASDYEDAARTAPAEVLETFARGLVVDRPTVVLDADRLVEVLRTTMPPVTAPRRRPESAPDEDADPLAIVSEHATWRRQALVDACERLLQGEGSVEFAQHLGKLQPQGAVRELVVLLEAHLRPDVPYRLVFGEGVRVDESGGRLSWLTPGALSAQRDPLARRSGVVEESASG
jgi:hypothetical protein